MILSIYSIKDVKVDAFMPLFVMQSDVMAFRAFHQLVSDDKTQVSKYPADFALYRLGTFNDATGVVLSRVEFLTSAAGIGAVMTSRDEVLSGTETDK